MIRQRLEEALLGVVVLTLIASGFVLTFSDGFPTWIVVAFVIEFCIGLVLLALRVAYRKREVNGLKA